MTCKTCTYWPFWPYWPLWPSWSYWTLWLRWLYWLYLLYLLKTWEVSLSNRLTIVNVEMLKTACIFGFVTNVHFTQTFQFFAVLLCGWLAQSHYSVRRPCHLSWKRFTRHNPARKDFFVLNSQKKLHNWKIISYHCNSHLAQCLYVQRGRHVIGPI